MRQRQTLDRSTILLMSLRGGLWTSFLVGLVLYCGKR